MSNGKSLIIFDMDGTIFDSSSVIAGAINYVRDAVGLKPMDIKTIVENINNPSINPAKFFYETENFSPVHQNLFSEFYYKNQDRFLKVYDGMDSLISELKEKNYNLAVATNAYRKTTIKSLQNLGLLKFFDEVICGDDVINPKPDPEMLLKLLKKLNRKAEEALFIGDGERDLIASKRAGIDFILVNWGFSNYSRDREVVNDVKSLREKILNF